MSNNPPAHVHEHLAAFALGTLPDAEQVLVATHLVGCANCATELEQTEELLASLAIGETPVAPSHATRVALLQAVEGGGRLGRFADQVARLLRISVALATETLDRLDAPGTWAPLPLPGATGGLSYFVPPLGEGLEGSTIAFLRLPPGGRFPVHTHLGPEQVLVLQGGYVDEQSGIEYGPGDLHQEDAGSTHGFVAVEGPDCFCLGLIFGRIQVDGQVF